MASARPTTILPPNSNMRRSALTVPRPRPREVATVPVAPATLQQLLEEATASSRSSFTMPLAPPTLRNTPVQPSVRSSITAPMSSIRPLEAHRISHARLVDSISPPAIVATPAVQPTSPDSRNLKILAAVTTPMALALVAIVVRFLFIAFP